MFEQAVSSHSLAHRHISSFSVNPESHLLALHLLSGMGSSTLSHISVWEAAKATRSIKKCLKNDMFIVYTATPPPSIEGLCALLSLEGFYSWFFSLFFFSMKTFYSILLYSLELMHERIFSSICNHNMQLHRSSTPEREPRYAQIKQDLVAEFCSCHNWSLSIECLHLVDPACSYGLIFNLHSLILFFYYYF